MMGSDVFSIPHSKRKEFKMKKWVALCAVLAAIVVVSPSHAAEPQGQIGSGALAGLGLSGMQQMSDDEGTQVRGRYARVSGWSSATVGAARTSNRYSAGGRTTAFGASESTAFQSASISRGRGRRSITTTVVVGASGGAIAFGR
jgi:hypothetical protein